MTLSLIGTGGVSRVGSGSYFNVCFYVLPTTRALEPDMWSLVLYMAKYYSSKEIPFSYKVDIVEAARKIGVERFFKEGGNKFVSSIETLREWESDIDVEFPPINPGYEYHYSYTAMDRRMLANDLALLQKRMLKHDRGINDAYGIKGLLKSFLNNEQLTTQEINELYFRRIIDDRNTLTDFGGAIALLHKNLSDQCESMGVHLEIFYTQDSLESIRWPEKYAIEHYCPAIGGVWYYTENLIFVFIEKYIIVPILEQIGLPTLRRPMLSEVLSNNMENAFLECFTVELLDKQINKLRRRKSRVTPKEIRGYCGAQGIDGAIIGSIFALLGFSLIRDVLEMELNEPKRMSYGWPDLVCLNAGEIAFIEVKRGEDKLTAGQMHNYKFFKKIGLDFYVLNIVSAC